MRTLTTPAYLLAVFATFAMPRAGAWASPEPTAHAEAVEAKAEVKKVVKPAVKPVVIEGKPAVTPATKPGTQAAATPPRLPEPRVGRVVKEANSAAGTIEEGEGGGEPAEITTAEQALTALRRGNQRWVAGTPTHPSTGMLRIKQTGEGGQKPFVSIITCADSRIPVERVFDRGVGEMFVVRVAGNITSTALTGTVEYGVGHLHTPLLVVMGHSKCGAVKATVEALEAKGALGPNIAVLAASITPAVDRARKQSPSAEGAELVELAVRENIWQTIFDLYKASAELVAQVQEGKLKVVGAVLDISTGQVEWLGEHPWQETLLSALAKPAEVLPATPTPASAPTPTAAATPTAEPATATAEGATQDEPAHR